MGRKESLQKLANQAAGLHYESTRAKKILDLCLSMARLEMEKIGAKCSTAGK